MPTFSVDSTSPTPIYAQLDRSIRAAIATGELEPGAQLPTVRQLAVDLAVNANTVARVYALLERDGMLETRRGVGTFVRESPSPRAARADPTLRRRCRAVGIHFNRANKSAQKRGEKINARHGRGSRSTPRRTGFTVAESCQCGFGLHSCRLVPGRNTSDGRHSESGLAGDLRVRRIFFLAIAQDREAVGAGRRAPPRQGYRPAWPGAFLDYALRRDNLDLHRPARDNDELRRLRDAHGGYRTGERGRRPLLDGPRFREGSARSSGLHPGGQLGGPDRTS